MILEFPHTDYGAAYIMFLRGHNPKLLTWDGPSHWIEYELLDLPANLPSQYSAIEIRRALLANPQPWESPAGLAATIAFDWDLVLQPSGLYARAVTP